MAEGNASRPDAACGGEDTRPPRLRVLWLCVILGLVAGATVVWLFGFSVWTALAFGLLVACPLAIAWALIIDRRQGPISRRTP